MDPAGATADHAPSRLGSSLHLKGEISGNEDLDIDGTVEGLVHIDERKLTVGATAKWIADVIADEVIVYGSVKGKVRGKGKIGCPGLKSGEAGYMFLFVLRCAIILPMHRAKGVRP